VTIPAAALADLALLLVLYFVLTTTYDADRLRIEIPISDTSTAAEIGSPCVVVAKGDRNGGAEGLRYRWYDGRSAARELANAEDLWLEVSRVADREPEATLVVKAEAALRWSQVDEVLELMRDAGARRVVLWTRPELAGGEGRAP
jgi:biopolymer transport protein ExbD